MNKCVASVPAGDTCLARDQLLLDIARYVDEYETSSRAAFDAARYCLMDALGCAAQGLDSAECVKLLGPAVPETIVPHGARVPWTQYRLDPATAAFNIGCMIRWLDFNDTWWAGGHPSDNVGGILAVSDHVSLRNLASGRRPLTMRDVMSCMIKAYEIQGVLEIENRFDRVGVALDSTMLVKIASAPVVTKMIGGNLDQIVNALSQAFVDGFSLDLYRHMPTSGSRKSWAGADASARAVQLALMTMKGEMGYPSALSAKTWGFQDALFGGHSLSLPCTLGSNVIENVQFKVSHPAQRHAQTAIECAIRLRPQMISRLGDIERVVIETHAVALRRICATGPLPNYAARDHCLQYIVAVGLIYGDLTTDSYTDEFAGDPRIDALRSRIQVIEGPGYTQDYHAQRSNANAVQVFFNDGSSTDRVEVHYPIGDSRRRQEGLPLLRAKFRANLARRFPQDRQAAIVDLFDDAQRFEDMPASEFMGQLAL